MWEGKKYYVEHIFLSVILVCEIWEVTILVDLQCKAVFRGLLCSQGNNPLPFQQGKGDHQNAALFPMAHQIRTALGKAGSGDVSMDHNSSCLQVHRQGTVKALHIDTLFSCLWLMLPHHPVQARPQHHECWSLYPRWETIHGINKMPGAPLPNQGTAVRSRTGTEQGTAWLPLTSSSLYLVSMGLPVPNADCPELNDDIISQFFNAHFISFSWITVQVPFRRTLGISTVV